MELVKVNYGQAQRLKNLGFDWSTDYHYCDDELKSIYNITYDDYEKYRMFAPEVALALKWCRDTQNIYYDGGCYIPNKTYRFYYGVKDDLEVPFMRTCECSSYEAAEIKLLDGLLDMIEGGIQHRDTEDTKDTEI